MARRCQVSTVRSSGVFDNISIIGALTLSVKSFLLCSGGKFDEQGFRELFAEPAKYPGSSATRRIDHNITDIQGVLDLPNLRSDFLW